MKGGAGEQGGMQWIELEVNAIICEQLGEGACTGKPDTSWLLTILTMLMGAMLVVTVM